VADTAVNYRGGQDEEILRQLLQGQRDRFMLFKYTVARDPPREVQPGRPRSTTTL
jgi:aryl-alcohol dehydrogenase-like predicted oxidoreductase